MSEPRQRRAARAAPPTSPPAQSVPIPSEVTSVLDDLAKDSTSSSPEPAALAPSTPAPGRPSDPDEARAKLEHPWDFAKNGPATFTTLLGVVLDIRSFPDDLASRVRRNMLPNAPKPPRKYIEADDKWLEVREGPAWEKFVEEVAEWNSTQFDVDFFVKASFGTSLRELPEGFSGPEDERWVEEITNPELFGVYSPSISPVGSKKRYVEWLQYYVLGKGDFTALYDALDAISGAVQETAVVEAMQSFRYRS